MRKEGLEPLPYKAGNPADPISNSKDVPVTSGKDVVPGLLELSLGVAGPDDWRAGGIDLGDILVEALGGLDGSE